MNPLPETAAREFIDLRTGDTWTLTYTRHRSGHAVGIVGPFGSRSFGPVVTADVQAARNTWRAIAADLARRGLRPRPVAA